MVRHASDAEQDAAFLAGNPGNVFFELVSKRFPNERFPIFGAEDDVVEQSSPGVFTPGYMMTPLAGSSDTLISAVCARSQSETHLSILQPSSV